VRHLAERAVAALKVRTLIIGNMKFGIPTIDLDSIFSGRAKGTVEGETNE